MTPEEIEIMELTKEVWSKFLQLPEQHPADATELNFHIHAIQNIVLARVGLREYKKEIA